MSLKRNADNSVLDSVSITVTEPPRPAPTPFPFSARLALRPFNNATLRMDVLSVATARLHITPVASSFMVDDYRYRLLLDDTGLYDFDTISQTHSCHPSYGNEETSWVASGSITAFLARCELGNITNQGIWVQARLKADHSQIMQMPWREKSYRLAAHRHPPEIVYSYSLASISGNRPSYMAGHPGEEYNDFVKQGVKRGAEMWTRSINNTDLFKFGTPSNTTIELRWSGPFCGTSMPLGCAKTPYKSEHASGTTEIEIAYPPQGEFEPGKLTYWTNDYAEATDQTTLGQYFFLPSVAAHELAHALGVGDTTYGLMGPYSKHEQPTPIENDRHGMWVVTSPHEHGDGGGVDD